MEEGFNNQISQFQYANSQQYNWTNDEIICLTENEIYYAKMLEVVAQAKITGPQKLPKPPKRKLDRLFKEKTKGKKAKLERSSADLHEYLRKNLVDINQKPNRKFFAELETSFDKLKEQLIYGYKQIQRQNAQTLLFYLQYGKMLITAMNVFKQQKNAGEYEKTWKIFLSERVGISLSYAGKLKDLAFNLDPQTYPVFEVRFIFF